MPIFGAPLFFIGLASLPALAGIYWLRNRFRRRSVSSLMLWVQHRQPKEGGRRLTRLQTPLLFFLELLALLLLVAAATGPMVLSRRASRPLIVVLDDSFSMLAGSDSSPRDRGREAVLREIGRDSAYSVRFILAGASSRLLGRPVTSTAEAAAMLDRWTCASPLANLDKAVALASEIGGTAARILVVTDHPAPDELPEGSRVQWWAFGLPKTNVAFVNAVRSRRDRKERCLFEIANLSEEPAARTLVEEYLADKDGIETVYGNPDWTLQK